MPSPFERKADRLLSIDRGEDTYGQGSAGEQAVHFYLDEMLDEAVERASARSDRLPRAPVGLLISLSGFSPVTTILACRLLSPERLLVISSEQTEASINVIADYLVGPGGLRHSDFMHMRCTPTDPRGIYRAVKDELSRSQHLDAEPYTIIDITGGRKVMSAAAALAAWQLKLDLCYVESEYDPERRQPLPGSDRLLLLDNPTALFGEQEMDAALQLFASGAFGVARQRYDELSNSVAEPGRARFMRALADLYEAWCDLELAGLSARIEMAETTMVNERHELTVETMRRIEHQLEFLRRLAEGDRNSLLVCFYVLGQHYQEIGRHDFAALLFYRTIEGCLVSRLERRPTGFSCDRPDYALLTDDVDQLLNRFRDTLAGLGKNPGPKLPAKVGLMSAAVLLTALDDALITDAQLAGTRALTHLEKVTWTRNKSLLAHGYEPIDADECRMLEAKATYLLRAYWNLQVADQDVGDLCRRLRFVQTDR